MMAKAPEKFGFTDAEISRMERKNLYFVLLFWSPFFVYLFLALLNGWKV